MIGIKQILARVFKSPVIMLIDKLSALVIVVVSVFYMFFALRGVEGDSMDPTIRSGEWFIMVKARPGTTFRRGDIVSFITNDVELEEKGQGLLKRVIGLPGDMLEISDHQGYFNGQPLDESYAH